MTFDLRNTNSKRYNLNNNFLVQKHNKTEIKLIRYKK